MDRSAFIKTLIEVLKYDRKYRTIESRDQLLRLIGRARVNFVPQYEFANHGRSYQHWEIVELRVPVPLLEIAEENEKILEELVEYVYEESDDYALHHVEIRPQVIDTPDEVTEHNVVFDAIQDEVIQGIRDAKFIIWAAVAWFSNEAIYQELLAKKKHGLYNWTLTANYNEETLATALDHELVVKFAKEFMEFIFKQRKIRCLR